MVLESEKIDSEMILESLPLWVGEGLWVHFKNLESKSYIAGLNILSLNMNYSLDKKAKLNRVFLKII